MTASFHCCGTFPSRQVRVVSQWSSNRMVRSCWSPSFSCSTGRPSGPIAFAFAIAFITVKICFSVDSIPRALATECCGSLFGMSGSSMSDLAFSSERKNRTHLSRIRHFSRSSLPPSSRTHCDSIFVSSSCTDLMFYNNPCWSPMHNSFSNSTTWRSKKRTTSAFRTLLSQLHAVLTALRSYASLVSVFRPCHAACIVSVAVRSSASVWASPLQPRPGLFRFWGGITNSAVRMMAEANAASTSSTLLSPGGFVLRYPPTAGATSCQSWGSVTRRLRSTGGLVAAFNRRFRAKWPGT